MTLESAVEIDPPRTAWARVSLVAVSTLAAWAMLLMVAPSAFYALCYLLALFAGVAIVAYPRLGVYLITFLLIGQWPFGMFRYLGMLTIASSFVYLLVQGKRLLPRNPILMLCGLFGCTVLASAIRPQTSVDLFSILLAYLANCALVWLLLVMVDSRQMILNIVRLMILAGVLTGIVGLVQWQTHFVWMSSTTADAIRFSNEASGGQAGFDLQQWRGNFRIDSIVGTPDYLPMYMQTISPFVAIMLVRQRLWSLRLALLATLALFAASHLLSYTRGALITTAVVVVLTGWVIDRRRFMLYAPLISVILAAGLLSWTPWRERLWTMFDLNANESVETVNTGAWRLNAIPVGIEIILDHPVFGVGVGQGKRNWPDSAFGTLLPDPKLVEPLPFHNDYLGVGVEMGLTGLAALLALLAKSIHCLAGLAKKFRRRGDSELADVASALLISTIGIAMGMMLYPLIGNFRYVWLVFGLTAVLVHYDRQVGRGKASE